MLATVPRITPRSNYHIQFAKMSEYLIIDETLDLRPEWGVPCIVFITRVHAVTSTD